MAKPKLPGWMREGKKNFLNRRNGPPERRQNREELFASRGEPITGKSPNPIVFKLPLARRGVAIGRDRRAGVILGARDVPEGAPPKTTVFKVEQGRRRTDKIALKKITLTAKRK
jgi:hypothetical protein